MDAVDQGVHSIEILYLHPIHWLERAFLSVDLAPGVAGEDSVHVCRRRPGPTTECCSYYVLLSFILGRLTPQLPRNILMRNQSNVTTNVGDA